MVGAGQEVVHYAGEVLLHGHRLFTEHARDVVRNRLLSEEELPETIEETPAEKMVREGDLRVAQTGKVSYGAERLEEELLRHA